LTGGRRTALPRQRTLRATLDWSHELLPETERRLLRRLAVFPGGFTIDTAAAVMKDTGLDAAAVTDGIANLVTKSLIALDPTPGTARWTLLETIRAYALEKLAEHAEADIAAEHHALYFRDLFTPQARGVRLSLSDEDFVRWIREIDNVRAALDWSFSPAGDQAIGVDLTVAYAPIWTHLLLMNECRERCERALLSLESHAAANTWPRMQLQIALADTLIITMGSASQATTVLTQALEAAETLDDLGAQARALKGLWEVFVFQDEHARARIVVERLGQIADRIGDPAIARVVDGLIGAALLSWGRLRESQRYYQRVLRSPVAPGDRHGAIYYRSDNRVVARAMFAGALWLQGFAEQALNEAGLGLEELHGTDYPLVLCRSLYFGVCRIATMTGDFATADRETARLIEVAARSNAHFWEAAGHFLKGQLLVERGEFAQGLLVLRDAFERCARTGWRLSYAEFKGALASGLAGTGQLDEALVAVDDAMAAAGEGENRHRWYVPELLRIKGEVLLRQAADQSVLTAEDCFNQAAQMAREQGALFWELRVALSVARLRVSQGRHHEARAPLASVYDRFTEGFATTDLLAARTLLKELPPS
jgi:predicted ATPase